MGSNMWTMLVVIGPLVLIAAVLFAVLSNRRSRSAESRTETATRDLYARTDREDKADAATEHRDV